MIVIACLLSTPVLGTLRHLQVSSTVAPTTTATTQPSTASPTTVGPSTLQNTCDVYCQGLNGGASYCKFDQNPPTCLGGDQTCGTIAICGPPVTVTPTQAVPTGDGTYEPACDTMCQSLNDEASYCKWWLPKPTCLGGDQPCGDQTVCTSQTWPPAPTPSLPAGAHPHESAPCNAYCIGLNGPSSFCKWWKNEPACQGGDQPCGPSDCATGTPAPTEGPPDSHAGPSPNCDAYCTSVNPGLSGDRVSYCKWWLYVPVCYDGDQPCGPSVCSNFGETTTPTPTTATPTTQAATTQAATTAAPTTQAATTAAPTTQAATTQAVTTQAATTAATTQAATTQAVTTAAATTQAATTAAPTTQGCHDCGSYYPGWHYCSSYNPGCHDCGSYYPGCHYGDSYSGWSYSPLDPYDLRQARRPPTLRVFH
ncbi:hypothetical protein FOZ60_012490 [Perkinsus olseni]|uniref:Uncharacterized protein n=1 Tax=Perkinsus olseni TaxID=32597 RepID=A0A7J6PA83_PEROL|nr:hypothetical protein FOZ60_012490 [Perkinsus olseni]